MGSFPIWHKWSLAWEDVSRAMAFDLGLYPQSHSVVTSPISWIIFICGTNITHRDDHFPVNKSKDNVTRAIRIFVVGARGYPNVSRSRPRQQFVVMTTSSNGNIFRVTGPLCEEFTGHRWSPLIKGQWRGALMFSLICAWTNGWVNNRGAGDLRHNCAHYDVIVISTQRLAHRHLL